MGLLQTCLWLLLVVGEFYTESGPYIVSNEDGGPKPVIRPFTSQMEEPITWNSIMLFGTFDRNWCDEYIYFINSSNGTQVQIVFEKYFNLTSPPRDSLSCQVVWGDGHYSSIKLEEHVENITHTYKKFGFYSMHIECKYRGETKRCPNINTECLEDDNVLDDVFQSFDTPLIFFSHKQIVIKSYMKLSNVSCGSPEIWWNVTRLENGHKAEDITIPQLGYSELHLSAKVLEIGTYIVSLYALFPAKSQLHRSSDFIIIKVVHPELVTHIIGGDIRAIPYEGNWIVNASLSNDPAEEIAFKELLIEWEFVYYNFSFCDFGKFTVIRKYPDEPLPLGGVARKIQNGTDYTLLINTTSLPVSICVYVIFTMSRGSRISSSVQRLFLSQNFIPIDIQCIYNCHIGRERIFNIDRIELEVNLPENTNTTALTYQWSIRVWNESLGKFTDPTTPLTLKTGRDSFKVFNIQNGTYLSNMFVFQCHYKDLTSPVLGISSFPIEGLTYLIYVRVDFNNGLQGMARIIRKANILPTGGYCKLGGDKFSTTDVVSGQDWLPLHCSSWTGHPSSNPYLTYTVIQRTEGAVVYEELILQTRSQRSHIILKTGNPDANYNTSLVVQVTDMYNDHNEVIIYVLSKPAFNTDSIEPTDEGASVVNNYIQNSYYPDERELRLLGKHDMIILLVSAVCSNINLINLPIWVPPAPRRLNTNGYVLDLNAEGNDDIGLFEDAKLELTETGPNPATLAIQQIMENLTTVIEDIFNISSERLDSDKIFSSLFLNALTNIVKKEQFINTQSLINVAIIGGSIGHKALLVTDDTDDSAAQNEIVAGEIYDMTHNMVNSVVPDDLTQNRHVHDILNGLKQIDEMLTVLIPNVRLDDSKLSPMERAYLYFKMQRMLRYYTDERKNASKQAASTTVDLARDVLAKLRICKKRRKKCNNRDTSLKQLIIKNTGANISADTISTKSQLSTFKLNGLSNALKNKSLDETGTVGVSAFEFDENVYMYDNDGTSAYVTSKILRLDVKYADVQIDPDEVTFDQFVQTPNATRVTPEVDGDDASVFMYHKFIYQKNTDHVCIIIEPIYDNTDFGNISSEQNVLVEMSNITMYDVYFSFGTSPTILDFDFKIGLSEDDDWTKCIPPSKMKKHIGITYFGVRLPGHKQTVDYNLTIITVGCLTWDEPSNKWHTDKCLLDWIPTKNKISCHCFEVTDMVFANTFYVAPNIIDFTTVFLKFSPLSQAAVMGTLIGIGVLYFIGVIVLRRFDKADRFKWCMTSLCDNVATDTQFYIIKVYTGIRKGGGTKSPIAFNLKGSYGETGPRSLSDGVRKGFARGSCMTFFMATSKWLGHLEYLSVWHDHDENQQFESWYLNQVVIIDISREQVYTFVAEQWLSVKTSENISMCSNTNKEPLSFEARFFNQTRNRLSEGHLLASIFYRPQFSVFTRVQRLSCALVYILLNMIANAMYFNPEPNYVVPALLVVGPIRFTSQQVYVSLISALITTPPVMLLVFLFNRTRARARSRLSCCCFHGCGCCKTSNEQISRDDHMTQSFNNQTIGEKLQSILLSDQVPEYYGKLYLSPCFVYINWCIVASGVIAPSFFVMLYSMEWGKQKSEEWLTSFFMSIIESAIIVDPVMVLCVALILALVQRVHTEKATTDIVEIVRKYRKMIAGKIYRDKKVTAPLTKRLLETIKGKKVYQTEVTTSLRDIILSMLFLWIVSSIANSARDHRSYGCHSEIVNTIVKPFKMPQFNLIKTPGDIYTWLNVSVFPSLFPEIDYNCQSLHWTDRNFMAGQNNIRVGPPRLRQLRSKKEKCRIPYIGKVECNYRYTLINEETESYCIDWKQQPCPVEEEIFKDSSAAWTFTSALDVWGLPLTGKHSTYSGGGYIVTFDVDLSVTRNILNDCFNYTWLNRQTRAVVFEFTLYNPGVNIFIYNEFLVEFPESGGALTSYNVYPMRLYDNHGGGGTYTLICQVFFVLCLLVFLVKICVRFYQQGSQYFCKFWQVFELIMFATGVTAIVAFFIRLGLTYATILKFEENKQRFVNFVHIALWDQIYVTLLGVLIFMATLRIIQTFSASKRINSIVRIFKDCGKSLFWFSTCFIYLLVGFCLFGLFLFGSKLEGYMSIYKSLTTLLLAMIGKNRFSEMEEMQPILAKIFFTFYIITVVFYTMTIFFSILGGSIDNVMRGVRTAGDVDLLDYVTDALKRLIKKPKAAMIKKNNFQIGFSIIERTYIHSSPPRLIIQSPEPEPQSDEKIWISGGDKPVLVWRPYPFCQHRTLKVHQKVKKGRHIFVAE